MPNIARTTKGDPDKPLTDKQRRFVEEYVVDMNATAAAVRAGYAHHKSGLYTLTMGMPHVKAAVERALAQKRAASAALARRVMEELAAIAFCNPLDYLHKDHNGVMRFDVEKLEHGQGRALRVLDVRYAVDGVGGVGRPCAVRMSAHNKVAALRTLARVLGLVDGAGLDVLDPARDPALDALPAGRGSAAALRQAEDEDAG